MCEKNDLPLVLAMDEAENKLVKTVNEIITDYSLPAYLLETLIDKIHRQIKDAAKSELVNAKKEVARKSAESKTEEESADVDL